jgi:hypothetical protein
VTQLSHGLTKLRRYMVSPPSSTGGQEAAWTGFCHGVRDIEALAPHLTAARNRHLQYNHWVYQLSDPSTSIPEGPLLPSWSAIGETAAFRSECDLMRRDPSKVMEAQNRLYEYFLRTKVEPARMDFAFGKFSAWDLDERFAVLRSSISESLYFANEAYVTCGGVLQVVGGKQQKSRKVGDDYTGKTSLHNIAYTVHELVQSAVDQLADIHKEAHRDFPRDGRATTDQLSATLLATGKYIHRLMNALKHMYRILNVILPIRRGDGKPFPELFPAAACPIVGSRPEKFEWWENLTNFAFGLEALKKTELTKGEPKVMELLALSLDGYQDVQNKRPGIPEKFDKGTASILVHKFRLSYADLSELFPKRALGGNYNKRDILLFAAARARVVHRQGHTINLFATKGEPDGRQANYYNFFNAFVQHALFDYFRYIPMEDRQLDPLWRPGAKRPFCLAECFIATSDAGVCTKEPWPLTVPVPALRAAAPRAGVEFGDDDDEEEYQEEEGA